MNVVETEDFVRELKEILSYIAKDKKSAAIRFNKDLRKKINDLKDFPFMYRISIYFENENIRDLTHKGYTIPYEVDLENEIISIIGITKHKKDLH
jgi:plasmid stabilization system protein ParE